MTVLTTHSVVAYVNAIALKIKSLRQTRLENILNAPHITFTHEGINMADNMWEGEPHLCEETVGKDVKVKTALRSQPLQQPQILLTDKCCYRYPIEGLKAAFAVVKQTKEGFEDVAGGKVTGKESAQLAELQGMIKALEWSGKECKHLH